MSPPPDTERARVTQARELLAAAMKEASFSEHHAPPLLMVPTEAALRAITKALASRDEAGGEWRPIEEAPKDGTTFLGATYRTDLSEPRWIISAMWWDDEFEQVGWDDDKSEPIYRGAFTAGRVASWNYEEYAKEHPTHFMKLPDPPRTLSVTYRGEGE